MAMIPFMKRFPDLGARETRSVRITGREGLPDGEYGFIELYCDEPGCDCRRVMIDVLRPDTGWNLIWASINYGWESLDFYRTLAASIDPTELKGPFLDPLNPQTKHSPALLDLFRFLILSPEYVQRLRTHYQMFRAAMEDQHMRKDTQEQHRVATRRKPMGHTKRRDKS